MPPSIIIEFIAILCFLFQLRCGEWRGCRRRGGGRALSARGRITLGCAGPPVHAPAPRVLPLPIWLRLRNVAQVDVAKQLHCQRKVSLFSLYKYVYEEKVSRIWIKTITKQKTKATKHTLHSSHFLICNKITFSLLMSCQCHVQIYPV